MTVSHVNITSGPYTGTGTLDTYAYDFGIEANTEIRVFETNDSDVQTELTLSTDFTVTGVGNDSGGTAVRVAGNLPPGYTWYIRSNIANTQLTNFQSQGSFLPAVHETTIDKNTRLIQQIKDLTDRAAILSAGYTGDLPLSMADPSPGDYVKWNSLGTGLENATAVSIVPGTVNFVSISAYASLTAAVAAIGATETTLLIDVPTTCTSNTTVPSTLFLWKLSSGRINQSAYTLTINSYFNANLQHVFTGTGAIVFGDNTVEKVLPQWWGGGPGVAAATNKTAINAALAAATGRMTYLCAGTWAYATALGYAGPVYLKGENWSNTFLSVSTNAVGINHDIGNGMFVLEDITMDAVNLVQNNQFIFFTATTLAAGARHYLNNVEIDHVRFLDENVSRVGTGISFDIDTGVFSFFGRITNCWFQDLAVAIDVRAQDSGTFGSWNGWRIQDNVFDECYIDLRTRGKCSTLIAALNHHQTITAANGGIAMYDHEGTSGLFVANRSHDLDHPGGVREYIFRSNWDGGTLDAFPNNIIGSGHPYEQAVSDANSAANQKWNTFHAGGVATDILEEDWINEKQIKTLSAKIDKLEITKNIKLPYDETIKTQADSPFQLTSAMSGQLITNRGAAGVLILTLPISPLDGDEFPVMKIANQDISYDPGANTVEDNTAGKMWQNVAAEQYKRSTLKWYENISRWVREVNIGTWTIEP